MPKISSVSSAASSSSGFADHLRVIAEREGDPFHALLDVVDDLVQRATRSTLAPTSM